MCFSFTYIFSAAPALAPVWMKTKVNAAELPVPDADYRTIERELRRSVADSLIARENSRRIGKTREVRQSLRDDARDRARLDETARNICVDLGSAPTLGRRVKVEACKARVTL